jgi:hypothetical protein
VSYLSANAVCLPGGLRIWGCGQGSGRRCALLSLGGRRIKPLRQSACGLLPPLLSSGRQLSSLAASAMDAVVESRKTKRQRRLNLELLFFVQVLVGALVGFTHRGIGIIIFSLICRAGHGPVLPSLRSASGFRHPMTQLMVRVVHPMH